MDEDRHTTTANDRASRRTQILLFVLGLGVYSYFYQAGGWNQNTRFDLVRSIVEQGSASIDSYHENTGDKAKRGDHYYSDKAPGTSWLAVPLYAVVYAFAGNNEVSSAFLTTASYLATVWAVSLPSAIALVMLFRLLGTMGLSVPARLAVALAYGFGTLAFPYATLFYGHQLCGALLLIGFALLIEARKTQPRRGFYFLTGVVLGYSLVVEYPAVLALVPIGWYSIRVVKPRQHRAALGLGVALPLLALLAYHAIVFGGPLTVPYEFSTQEHRGQGFFMGLGAPQDGAFSGILVSSNRGLFYSSPWLLLALPGAAWLWRRRKFRAEVVVCFAVAFLFVWLNVSLVDWQGGSTLGARYLIPALPFLAIVAGGVGLRPPRKTSRLGPDAVWVVFSIAAVWSVACMTVGTAVSPEVDIYYRRPFEDILFPAFQQGFVAVNSQSIDSYADNASGRPEAWNVGGRLGLEGRATLIPLGVFVSLMFVLLRLSLGRGTSRGPPEAPLARPRGDTAPSKEVRRVRRRRMHGKARGQ